MAENSNTRMAERPVYDDVGLRLLAALLITAMSALVREVSGSVTQGQIVFWRSALALPRPAQPPLTAA